jgi:transcriptional regulator with XRE-family HTH domain
MLSKRLIEARKKLGFTSREDFANSLNMPFATLRAYEQGKIDNIPHTFLQKLNEQYNIQIDWLLTGKGEMFINETKPEQSTPANTLNSHIADREMEIIKAFRELSADEQELFYYKIKAKAVEERIKNQE